MCIRDSITADKVAALAGHVFHATDVDAVFLCGPGSMIRDVRNALFAIGLPRDRVHHEFFAAGGGAYRAGAGARPLGEAPAEVPGRSGKGSDPGISSTDVSQETEIVATLDGTRYRFMGRPGEAIVDAALRAGIRAPYACKGGMCSTCRARLVEGEARMAVNYSLEPWELDKGFILTCQAHATSPRVVVDFDQM